MDNNDMDGCVSGLEENNDANVEGDDCSHNDGDEVVGSALKGVDTSICITIYWNKFQINTNNTPIPSDIALASSLSMPWGRCSRCKESLISNQLPILLDDGDNDVVKCCFTFAVTPLLR